LFHYKDKEGVKERGARFRLSKNNEDQMFLNADEIMYKAKKNKRLSFNRSSDSEPKGAIVLSYSKELLN
jgi:hypothetical protein